MIKIKSIDTLREVTSNGCRFISFLYTTKGTEETNRYTLKFGVNHQNALLKDKASLEAYTPKDALEEQAKAELMASLEKSLTPKTIEEQKEDPYDHIGKGIKQHKENGNIYLWGYIHERVNVAPAKNPKKPVNSRPLTLAKNAIKKACDFKSEKGFGTFILNPSHIAGIVVNGDVVEIHS
jgi:hypothetical protein